MIKEIKELESKLDIAMSKAKELTGKIMVKEAELDAKDMLIIDLLWLLIDNGICPIKEGYEDLIKEHDIQYKIN